eukprot:CAMPEP_0172300584 /NCGR_PEP_ID=MMETSP1058-20130122/2642_1 /TAXON_ID=83371 /ORGANISM="Detonula confervacea, Strain CCMP 353" /LENGTH=268 /DNA_ID=CAMNT_0013010407 /DNA_START=442 /DNA_END=1245 /DNA_ORIENTATION=-
MVKISLEEAVTRLRSNDDTFTELSLHGNNIDDEGARELADALKENNILVYLDLESNKIGDEGARSLADALTGNKTLTYLYLRSNDIGDDGARAMADALKGNNTLIELQLGHNNIGGEGARALAIALEDNTTLISLDLEYNGICDEGASTMADALKGNSTLTILYLGGNNNIGDTALGDVDKLMSRNKLHKEHSDGIETQGYSFYFGTNDNDEIDPCIKATVWAAATTGDGLILGLVQNALQKYLAEGREDDLTSKKESFKKLFNEGRN